MFTVTVGLVGSGKRSPRRPLARRYSVIPSTEVTLTGAADCAAGLEAALFAAFCSAANDDAAIAMDSNTTASRLTILAIQISLRFWAGRSYVRPDGRGKLEMGKRERGAARPIRRV